MKIIGRMHCDGTGRSSVDALIYNREELNGDAGLSDGELLLQRVHECGYDSLRDVNGDFAGGVVSQGALTLFRDHLGVRPLYYYIGTAWVAYATDIRDLAQLQGVDLSVNERQLWGLLNGNNILSSTETDFAHIHCIPPGGYLTIRYDGTSFCCEEHTYWRPGQRKVRLANDQAYIAEMRRLAEDSIRRRLSVFPGTVAAELSGGLDSSVISILIHRLGRDCQHVVWRTVPEDWPLQPNDERLVVRDICQQEGFTCQYLPEMSDETYEEVIARLEPPFANTMELGEVAKLVSRDGIHAVFSGQGGDEGVSHRANVLELLHHGEVSAFFHEIWASTHGRRLRLVHFCSSMLKQVCWVYPRRLRQWKGNGKGVPAIIAAVFRDKMALTSGAPLYFNLDAVKHIERGGLRVRPETAAYQAEEYGVRYVFPYEDYRLMDFALSIPRHLFMRNRVNRWIYRQAFGDLMPDSLRKVHYKDAPSIRQKRPILAADGQKHDNSAAEQRQTGQDELPDLLAVLVGFLDHARWDNYLNFGEIAVLCQNHEKTDTALNSDYEKALDIVHRCWLIQKLQECPKHEWHDI